MLELRRIAMRHRWAERWSLLLVLMLMLRLHGTGNKLARSVHTRCVELSITVRLLSSEMTRSGRSILTSWIRRITRSTSIHLSLERSDWSRTRAVERRVLGFVRYLFCNCCRCCCWGRFGLRCERNGGGRRCGGDDGSFGSREFDFERIIRII
jgi:hypothetical protein